MRLRLDHPLWQRWAPVLARTLMQIYLRTCSAEVVGSRAGINLVRSGTPVLFTT